MCDVQTLRAFVHQRLIAAAEDIMEQFVRTLAKNEQLRGPQKLLEAVFSPHVHRKTADVQLLMVTEEEVDPEQQGLGSHLDQEDSPEPPHIKEEHEEVQTNQQGELLKVKDQPLPQDVLLLLVTKEKVDPEQQDLRSIRELDDPPEPPHIKEEEEKVQTNQKNKQLQGLKEEEGVTELTFSLVPMKSEDDEEIPQSSLHLNEEVKTEDGGEECGKPEPNGYIQRDGHLQPDEYQILHSSEPEDGNNYDPEETSERQSDSNQLRNNQEPECNLGTTQVGSSECGSSFGDKKCLQQHSGVQTEETFSCSVCKVSVPLRSHFYRVMRTHRDEKSFTCPICSKVFRYGGHLKRHIRSHTGEKPFNCLVCGKRFSHGGNLSQHTKTHTGEKPFICSVCGKGFSRDGSLTRHMRIHTGEKLFTCSVCSKRFSQVGSLKRHMTIHTGEKSFSCSL